MTAGWEPTSNSAGWVWIGLGRQQRRANGVLMVIGMLIGASVVGLVDGASARESASTAFGTLIGAAIAAFVIQRPGVHLFGVYVSPDALQIRRGIRARSLPWSEITDIHVERRGLRGGAVVVIEGSAHQALPAPVSAQRGLRRWFGDPDFDVKVAFIRTHLSAGADGVARSPRSGADPTAH